MFKLKFSFWIKQDLLLINFFGSRLRPVGMGRVGRVLEKLRGPGNFREEQRRYDVTVVRRKGVWRHRWEEELQRGVRKRRARRRHQADMRLLARLAGRMLLAGFWCFVVMFLVKLEARKIYSSNNTTKLIMVFQKRVM